MVVCPECGERATLENYEAWTPTGGWKKTERITCLNVRPKQGEPCGKKTLLSETKLDRDGSPLLPSGPGSARKPAENGAPAGAPRPEQPTPSTPDPDPVEAPVEDPQEVQDGAKLRLGSPPAGPSPRESALETTTEQPDVEADEDDAEAPDDEQPNNDPGGRRFPKYSLEQYQRLIELVESGMTCPQASTEVGIQVNTAYGIIGKYRRSLRGQSSSAPRRAVLTLLPSCPGGTTTVARLDAPFKTSSLMTQLKTEGVGSPGRLLNSPDLETFFKLTPEAQENLRIFHAMRNEIVEAEKWTEEVLG